MLKLADTTASKIKSNHLTDFMCSYGHIGKEKMLREAVSCCVCCNEFTVFHFKYSCGSFGALSATHSGL